MSALTARKTIPERSLPEKVREKLKIAAASPQPSLAPGEEMMDACAENEPWATSIRDSWQSSVPVRIVHSIPDRMMVHQ